MVHHCSLKITKNKQRILVCFNPVTV